MSLDLIFKSLPLPSKIPVGKLSFYIVKQKLPDLPLVTGDLPSILQLVKMLTANLAQHDVHEGSHCLLLDGILYLCLSEGMGALTFFV